MFEDQGVDCDIMICNKEYVFGLVPGSGPKLLKPLEFPVMRTAKVFFCYVNEITLGKSLDNLRKRISCQGSQPCGWWVGTFISTLETSGS